jgi:signal transduction histidine kinase
MMRRAGWMAPSRGGADHRPANETASCRKTWIDDVKDGDLPDPVGGDVSCESRAQLAPANSELEAKVREQTARLVEIMAELEQMSYCIMHDFRAPLRAIHSFSEPVLAESGEHLSQTSNDLLRRITGACRRMDGLLRDALTYSDALQHKLPLGPVDVEALLRGMTESYPQFQAPGIEIRVEGSFPRVLGNEGGLTQCFSHLLDNALKFVKPGTAPRVRIWAERRRSAPDEGRKPKAKMRVEVRNEGPGIGNEAVRVCFEDNGIGVPEDRRDILCLMFRQEDVGYRGMGIGLPLVRKLITRMGGRVGMESVPGHGSCFWVELRSACPQKLSIYGQ